MQPGQLDVIDETSFRGTQAGLHRAGHGVGLASDEHHVFSGTDGAREEEAYIARLEHGVGDGKTGRDTREFQKADGGSVHGRGGTEGAGHACSMTMPRASMAVTSPSMEALKGGPEGPGCRLCDRLSGRDPHARADHRLGRGARTPFQRKDHAGRADLDRLPVRGMVVGLDISGGGAAPGWAPGGRRGAGVGGWAQALASVVRRSATRCGRRHRPPSGTGLRDRRRACTGRRRSTVRPTHSSGRFPPRSAPDRASPGAVPRRNPGDTGDSTRCSSGIGRRRNGQWRPARGEA